MKYLGKITDNKDLVTKEYVDSKTGKQFHVAAYGNAGSTYVYRKLATLPIDNSANGAAIIVNGRAGGYVASNIGEINVILTNRTSSYSGTDITAICNVGGLEVFTFLDLVVYSQTDKSAILYLALRGYFNYDLTVSLSGASAEAYSETYVTPIGTEIWKLSTAKKIRTSKDADLEANKLTLSGKASLAGSLYEDL